ncbi:hypothetical protein [Bradyrhizobium prioriisuperbiae]|uniref:hypothetical protein n=1 Tax=Bradyrhizobium prioriisuperbiae TaxID=2854389 RepID=UPI0028E87FCE|nr:hypothetical protein [Bradyrhizobium prioritasuperba]
MRQLKIALVLFVAMSAPLAAQEFDQNSQNTMSLASAPAAPAEKASKPSVWRIAASEVAIARYRAALKLTAAQQKYWPGVASALRTLARMERVDENAVRRVAPSISPLLASLDENQKQTAMSLVQRAGLAQYASLF